MSLPTVATSVVSDIEATRAMCGGVVTDAGTGLTITAEGVCWNTTGAPTTADSKTSDGTSIGQFISAMTGLIAGTTYYVRAYAISSVGTGYGAQVVFKAASAVDIVTLDSLRTYLNNPDTKNDAMFSEWITLISNLVESKLEQPVIPRRVVDIVDGSGTYKQSTITGRIVNMTADVNGSLLASVQYRSNTISDWQNMLWTEGYIYVDVVIEPYCVQLVNWASFPRWIKNIRLDYNCGFIDPALSEIKKMVMEMIQVMWDDSKAGGMPRLGMQSKSHSGSGTVFTDTFLDMNPRWQRLIDRYKRLLI